MARSKNQGVRTSSSIHRVGPTRRDLLVGGGALLASSAVHLPVLAQTSQDVVLANWGGPTSQEIGRVWTGPLKDQGLKLSIDTGGPTAGKIRNMVESRNVAWDICDSGIGTTMELGAMGLLEPIDYTIVDRNKVLPGWAVPYGVAAYSFSSVLAYDRSKLQGAPSTWADFWDVQRFPGKRLLNRNIQGVLEVALMADGVPANKLYPLDVDRALAKIKQLKPHLLYWNTAADSMRMLRDGEVTMAMMWHSRAQILASESQGRVAWTFNQGILQPGMYVVPKGSPRARAAMRAIALMQQPAGQLELLKSVAFGPINPAAAALATPADQESNPTSEANLRRQVAMNAEWYGTNQSKALQAYLDVISS